MLQPLSYFIFVFNLKINLDSLITATYLSKVTFVFKLFEM